jgi:hypothetical protein
MGINRTGSVRAEALALFVLFQRHDPIDRNGESGFVTDAALPEGCRSFNFLQEYVKSISPHDLYVVPLFDSRSLGRLGVQRWCPPSMLRRNYTMSKLWEFQDTPPALMLGLDANQPI